MDVFSVQFDGEADDEWSKRECNGLDRLCELLETNIWDGHILKNDAEKNILTNNRLTGNIETSSEADVAFESIAKLLQSILEGKRQQDDEVDLEKMVSTFKGLQGTLTYSNLYTCN